MSQPHDPSHYAKTHGNSTAVTQFHSWRTAENSAPYLLPYLKPDMKILDVGCGPGSITISLASHVPQGHITGVDYAPVPIQAALALASSTKTPNVTFQTADIFSLPFPDASFDVTHAHQVLQHISEPVRALKELRRVTKPGGLVACRETDVQTFIWYPENPALQRWSFITESIARRNDCEPRAGRRLKTWARSAGFKAEDIKCTAGTWCFSSPEERAYWGGSIVKRFEESHLSASAMEGGFATKEEIEETVKALKEWVEDEDGWFGLMHGQMIAKV
ncbi:S-adenosyl-L-methionine-dependent methyltransferase [Irpex rosettiformis]|uniref:S-adenosyl-L-methionine-dependent methyltransferase n=1 Tax=Irpex rosettiformis TaxID=378272 RepID=A0ACB8UF15_9APHY|nr:S-adenosyl-L-methionine-dependent methyltransferase [Irpex rosettiformis]